MKLIDFDNANKKMQNIPQLYVYAQILVASDDLETKYGSVNSDWDKITSLEVILKALFNKEHFLEYLHDFVVHEKTGETYIKKIAMYHQFYTVREAVKRTKECILKGKNPEERRIGVVWHTSGIVFATIQKFSKKKYCHCTLINQ